MLSAGVVGSAVGSGGVVGTGVGAGVVSCEGEGDSETSEDAGAAQPISAAAHMIITSNIVNNLFIYTPITDPKYRLSFGSTYFTFPELMYDSSFEALANASIMHA